MSRLVMVLLLLALPLQFSWAAAAGYCLHGMPGHHSHFGHHEHRHDSAPADAHAHGQSGAASSVQGDADVSLFDDDCVYCHLGSPSLPAAAPAAFGDLAEPVLAGPPMPAITSPDAPRHERPNWRAA